MEIIFGLTIVGGLLFLALVAPVLAWLRTARAETELRQLRARLGALEAAVRDLAARPAGVAPTRPAEPPAPAPEVIGAPVVTSAAAVDHTLPAPLANQPPVPLAPVTPAPMAAPAVVADADAPAETPAGATLSVAATVEREDEENWLEAAIGGRLLLYVGTVALVLGVAFFLKYAFDRNWITEWMRVGLGALGGLALIAAGLRFARIGYAVYGQMLTGGGLGVLYLAVYAAFDFYGLIGPTTAFLLLLAVTVAAAALADRQRSQAMAVMAVGSGFLTPFLVGGGTDAQVTLFSYIALLVAGTMYLAHRRGWPALNILSYMLAVLTITAWAAEYYTKFVYLRTELFLTLFCAMFLYIRRETRRSSAAGAGVALVVLASAPVLYHFASVAILFNRSVALLVYLIAFSLVGVWWAIRTDRPLSRLVLWAAVMLPLLGWMAAHARWTWVTPALVTLAAVFALHLVAQFDRLVRLESTLSNADLLLLHLNGLGAFFGAWVLLEQVSLARVPFIGLGLALLYVVIARQMRRRDLSAALHALAVGLALLAATVAVQLDGAWLTAAWAAEGAAVIWIGVLVRRAWFRVGGALLLGAAIGRWLAVTLPQTAADFHLVMNETFLLGAWIVVMLYAAAWAHHRATPRVTAHRLSLAALLVTASVMTVLMLTADSTAYWNQRGETSPDATFASGLTLSLVWAFYAAVLIVIGIRRRYAPIRYAAMALFGLTIGKVFLVDLSGLEGIYRVVGLMIVGAVLLGVSFLYQRVVKTTRDTGGQA